MPTNGEKLIADIDNAIENLTLAREILSEINSGNARKTYDWLKQEYCEACEIHYTEDRNVK